jgi:uncharacterized integral membrane protein
MKLLFWIVGVPLVLAAAFFAVDNREAVSVSFWPFADPLQVPLFVAIITPLYVGVVLGAIVAWVSGRGARSRARSEARRAAAIETECAALKARLDAAERRAAASPAAVLPATPPTPAPVLQRP